MGDHQITSTAENYYEPYDDDDDNQSESLSLRDLPTTVDHDHDHHQTTTSTTTTTNHSRRSSSDNFFFEFLVNNNNESPENDVTYLADDIIFRGQLLPSTPHIHRPPPPRRSLSLSSATPHFLSPPQSKPRIIRPSRSLNYRKLRRNLTSSNSNTKIDSSSFSRNSSNNSNSDNPNNNSKLPPWYNWLVLGIPARIPAEMELKDIKNRQFRRSNSPQASLFSGDRSSVAPSWRFLNVLSCKSHTSVDVMKTTVDGVVLR